MIILLSLVSLSCNPAPLLPLQLASTLLSQLDPMADSTPPPLSDLLPSYTHPKTVFTTLPGISQSLSLLLPPSSFCSSLRLAVEVLSFSLSLFFPLLLSLSLQEVFTICM